MKLLEEILGELRRIRLVLEEISKRQLDILESLKVKEEKEEVAPLDAMALLSLPDHLRKTALALGKLGEARAEDVARETGRERAVESSYLNQLVRMGYVKKKRRGHEVWFYV
ncbi:MAG: transcriptional regulator [Candidatus Methanomethylicota archaeon]|uniref:Transcriptional regulator n=1 Tax=Thermoproteota archaeon TaxID=2056631 RepID=A0A497EVW5_9CREN|nr:MAG: transcriptional regulator [Candidatus Verstraetearchaeota archaeon]